MSRRGRAGKSAWRGRSARLPPGRRGRVAHELREPLDCLRAQRGGVVGDVALTGLLDARHTAIERGDQLLELARQLARRYHHRRRPPEPDARRPTFHTSPHGSQRQYAFSSGLRDVVLISVERHDGHMTGTFTSAVDVLRPAAAILNSYRFTVFPHAKALVRA